MAKYINALLGNVLILRLKRRSWRTVSRREAGEAAARILVKRREAWQYVVSA